MAKFILLAIFLLVTGCTTNNNMKEKQVTPKHQTRISTHAAHNAAPTPIKTQASSTATSNAGKGTITTKEAPIGIPSNLLDLIQTPGGYPTNEAPNDYYGDQVPPGSTGQAPSGPTGQAPSGPTGQTPAAPTGQAPQGNGDSSQFAQQVLDLVNQERSKAGLNSLSMREDLSKMAMVKAQDMYNNNYFDHNSPTHGSPFDMMSEFGITYNTAGENIANGQSSPTQVMNDWMNSPGHKANILNSSFTHIGIAYYNNEWVQEFTG
ncbi:CAP domain-containing protein [Paenibacillus sp. UNC451MF]|uniref:CAP domain-containing protein n=1 Tax=Paenibacillus sp. UNC451MF TaxID=1449063 RepID=UPI00048F78BC|nr:CAP domain-containing protein [Paenibacillus sp. UNC451MF]